MLILTLSQNDNKHGGSRKLRAREGNTFESPQRLVENWARHTSSSSVAIVKVPLSKVLTSLTAPVELLIGPKKTGENKVLLGSSQMWIFVAVWY